MIPSFGQYLIIIVVLALNGAWLLSIRVESFTSCPSFVQLCQDRKPSRRQCVGTLSANVRQQQQQEVITSVDPSGPSSLFIYYSPSFYRHVICEQSCCTPIRTDGRGQNQTDSAITTTTTTTRILKSFDWLDEAIASYPDATIVPIKMSLPLTGPVVVGGGFNGDVLYNASSYFEPVTSRDESTDLSSSIFGSFSYDSLLSSWSSSPQHAEALRSHDVVMEMFREKLGFSLYSRFSEADHQWVKERIVFLLSPLSPANTTTVAPHIDDTNKTDWLTTFMRDGYGVGLTIRQAFLTIQGLRHLLMVHPREASENKPGIAFFYGRLRVTYDNMDRARNDWECWLTGAQVTDAATIAFLLSIGVTKDQCQVLMEAFAPSLLSCELEPIWDVLVAKKVRKILREDAIHFLRMRLRLDPRDIYGLFSMSPTVSKFSRRKIKTNLNTFQETTNLPSKEMRRLYLTNPRILGVTCEHFKQYVAFLMHEVNLDESIIRNVIIRSPTSLFRSIDNNLRPKLDFLRQEMLLSPTEIRNVVKRIPDMLTASKKQKLRPFVKYFQSLGLSIDEVRTMVVKNPSILTLNLRNGLIPKMKYLRVRLRYDESELLLLLINSPHLLLNSVGDFLEPRIQQLEQAANSASLAAKIILNNPNLLLASNYAFQRRLQLYQSQSSEVTFEEYFSKKDTMPMDHNRIVRRRSKNSVTEIDETTWQGYEIFHLQERQLL